jgi:C-methyltransferase.
VVEVKKLLNKIKSHIKIIHGYGASTKGNVLLQYYNISDFIKYIADRNSHKVGLYTPDKKIKIISELMSRKLNPEYYFVLPWHFKENIIRREKKIFKNKSKFIFPLPNLKII